MNPVAQRNRKNDAFPHIQNAHVSEDVQLLCNASAGRRRELRPTKELPQPAQHTVLDLLSRFQSLPTYRQTLIFDGSENGIFESFFARRVQTINSRLQDGHKRGNLDVSKVAISPDHDFTATQGLEFIV